MNPKYYVSGKQAHHLRGLGHHLSPVAMLGKEGITENLLSQVEAVLAAHELIKVRIQDGCPYDRAEAAELLAEKTRSRIAQIIGKVFLLYRENKDLAAEKKIALPAKSGATTPANPKPASPRKPRTNAKAPACACKPEDKPARPRRDGAPAERTGSGTGKRTGSTAPPRRHSAKPAGRAGAKPGAKPRPSSPTRRRTKA